MTKKILIVDDDPGICNSLIILLRGEGYCVDGTTNSQEAALLIEKEKYDVCFFDYKMKNLSGMDLLKKVKKTNPRCPVFIITGMLDGDQLCKKEIQSGVLAGIISKPFFVEVLLEKITALDKSP